jgi:hypothetical protein
MTAPDAKASGEYSIFLTREIMPEVRELERVSRDTFCDEFLCAETVEPLLRRAWEAGREYGRVE